MKVLPEDAGDEAVLAAIREWVGLMAADDYEAAAAYLHPDEKLHLRETIGRYEAGLPLFQGPARVTPAGTAGGPFEPLEEIFRSDDGVVRSVDYALPINGEWSELVAFFDTVKVEGGLALRLSDVRVA